MDANLLIVIVRTVRNIDFIDFLKNRRSMITIDRPDDYEWAQQQALMFLDAPPFMLDGRYGSRDSLYNGD